jgi:uncharacterized repeat protein (TIGR04138 family)
MSTSPDFATIRQLARRHPEAAFNFVRDGLAHAVSMVHGGEAGASAPTTHISGPQLCLALRSLAIERFGMLAGAVLRKWGIERTDDFGVIVYAMIDRGEIRQSASDQPEDFSRVFDFDEAFSLDAVKDLA